MKIGILRQVLTYVYPSCAVCYTFKNQVCTPHPKTVFNSIQNSFRRKLHLDEIYSGCLKYYFSLITRPNLIVSLLYWNNYKDVT